MTTLFKLTDVDMRTYNGYQWALNGKHTASGKGKLCSSAWLHAYTDPLLAILLNPIHADIKSPRLFRAEGIVGTTDCGLKVGCTELTLVEELTVPVVTTVQRGAFGILCTKEVYKDPAWNKWADAWLDGSDRSEKAAEAAGAAEAAARAARAARAAGAARAARAAEAAAEAAEAARAAAEAAEAAAGASLDLIALAQRAMRVS